MRRADWLRRGAGRPGLGCRLAVGGAYPECVARSPVAMLGHAVSVRMHQRPAVEGEAQQLLQLRQLRCSPLLALQREVIVHCRRRRSFMASAVN
jgi:hypothetical protein